MAFPVRRAATSQGQGQATPAGTWPRARPRLVVRRRLPQGPASGRRPSLQGRGRPHLRHLPLSPRRVNRQREGDREERAADARHAGLVPLHGCVAGAPTSQNRVPSRPSRGPASRILRSGVPFRAPPPCGRCPRGHRSVTVNVQIAPWARREGPFATTGGGTPAKCSSPPPRPHSAGLRRSLKLRVAPRPRAGETAPRPPSARSLTAAAPHLLPGGDMPSSVTVASAQLRVRVPRSHRAALVTLEGLRAAQPAPPASQRLHRAESQLAP